MFRLNRLVMLGWASRLSGMVVSFVVIRIALQILGEDQFAVFQILVAALGWISLSSFGLGLALKNLVSECRARGESDLMLREASAQLIVLLFILGACLLGVAAPGVTAGLLRKLTHDQVWAYRAFVAGGILGLITALGQVGMEVLYAEFRAALVYWLLITASILTLASLRAVEQLHRPASELVFWLVCVTIGPQALTGVVGLWMTRLFTLRLRVPSSEILRRISGLALRFWGYTLAGNAPYMVDYLIISQVLVAREIAIYSIMKKLITIGVVLFTTSISLVWPAWTHDWELKEFARLRKQVRSLSVVGVVVCIPGAVFMVLALPTLLRAWLGDTSLAPSTFLVVAFVASLAVRLWTDVHAAALLAGSRVGSAIVFVAAQTLIAAPLEFLFGRRWGAEGVIVGLLVGSLTTVAWLFPRRFYSELGAQSTLRPLTIAGGSMV